MLDLYETFYKLSADPFRLSPDHRFVLDHRTYAKSRSYLEYALHRGEGFIVITGGPGTGKTTLINEILAQLDKTQIQVATLTSTQLESRDLLHMVAASFGLPQKDADKAGFLLDLEEFLKQQGQRRRRAVLIVDEAQGLSPGALEELRLLANLQFNNRLLLQVFLVGQEPLRELIGKPEMDHLRQRIVAASHIDPLKLNETVDYVEHRLNRVGWHGNPRIDAEALTLIHAFSGGIPRKINLICSRLFLYGAMEKKHALVGADARNVIEDLQQEHLMEPMEERGNGTTGTFSRIGMPAEEFATASLLGLPREKKTADNPSTARQPQPAADKPDETDTDSTQTQDRHTGEAEIREVKDINARPAASRSGERDIWGEIEELKQELEESYEEFETQGDVTPEVSERPVENPGQPARTVWPASDTPTAKPAVAPQPVGAGMTTERRDRRQPRKGKSGRWGGRLVTTLVFILLVAGFVAAFLVDTSDIERTVATVSEKIVGPQNGTIQREDSANEQSPGVVQLPDTGNAEESIPESGSATSAEAPVIEQAVEQETGREQHVAEGSSEKAGADGSEPEVPPVTGMAVTGPEFTSEAESSAPVIADIPVVAESVTASQAVPPKESKPEPVVTSEIESPTEDEVVKTIPPQEGSAPVTPAEEPVHEAARQANIPSASTTETKQAQIDARKAQLRLAAEKRLDQRLAGRRAVAEKKTDKVPSLTDNRPSPVKKPKPVPPPPVKPKTKPSPGIVASRHENKPKTPVNGPERTRSALLGGAWTSRGKPATLLPSEITHCQQQGTALACWSVPQDIGTKYGPAVYKVEATLEGFSTAGKFRLSYRTLVRLVADNSSAEADNGKWQISEHSMTCQLTRLSKILCRDAKGVEREYRRL